MKTGCNMKILLNGIETDINESDVINAVKDEYEKQMAEKDNEIKILKEKHEADCNKIREEHIKQIRAILSGKQNNVIEEPEFEGEEKTIEQTTLESAKKYLKIIKGI